MQNHSSMPAVTRRTLLGSAAIVLAGLTSYQVLAQERSTPDAPAASGWMYTDVLGNTVSLAAPPVRIAANLVTAAALWDFGIKVVAVFDSTASAHPDGDHIAWGNIDASSVVNVGDADGNILPEALIAVQPDIVLTLTFNPDDPSDTAGVPPDLAGTIGHIAPVLVVTDMDATDIQLQRLEDIAASLGADLTLPEIAAARTAHDDKIEEFRTVAAEKSALQVLFIDFDPGEIYIGGPQGVAELQFLASLGLKFSNADSEAAGDFWETLSPEQALKYPADVIYNDIYSTLRTTEDLQSNPVYGAIPAVTAGQVGLWRRDFPVSYAGVTAFLEDILSTLRTAGKLS